MAFKDDYDFDLLFNEAENLVIEELGNQLSSEENTNICKCQECVLDMATLSLNKLKPIYRSSFTGIVYSQQYYSGDYKTEVENIVKDAIKKVSSNPSHELSK
jgi:competence protein ComFB